MSRMTYSYQIPFIDNQIFVRNHHVRCLLHCYSQSCQPHSSWLFHDLTGIISSFQHSIPEAVNGGTVSWGEAFLSVAFFLFCREWLVTNSVVHKATVQPATIQNGLWRAFCMVASFDILGIIPGKPVEWL